MADEVKYIEKVRLGTDSLIIRDAEAVHEVNIKTLNGGKHILKGTGDVGGIADTKITTGEIDDLFGGNN